MKTEKLTIQDVAAIIAILSSPVILFTGLPDIVKILVLLCCFLPVLYLIFSFKFFSKAIKITTIFLLLYIISWIGYTCNTYYVHKKQVQELLLKDKRKNSIFNKKSNEYKILILPFETYGNDNTVKVGSVIFDRLQEINEKEKLNCNIVYWNEFKGKITNDSLIYWKNFHLADLIISGKYLEGSYDKPQFLTKYIANENSFLMGKSSKLDADYIPVSLVGIAQGEFQSDIEFVIQFIVAYKEIRNGNYKTALNRFSKISNTFNPYVIDYFMGSCFQYLGNIKRAISLQSISIKKNSNFYPSHADLGRAYLLTGEYNLAKREYAICTKLKPFEKYGYFGLGLAKRHLKDYEGSISEYTKVIYIDPKYKKAYTNRGVVETLINDFEGAQSDFSKAIILEPLNAKNYVNRGSVKLKLDDSYGAVLDFNQAINLDPKLAEAYFYRGTVELSNNEFNSAIKDYTIAIENEPKELRYYFNRGMANQKNVNQIDAINDFSKVIELDPKYADAYYYRAKSKAGLRDFKGYKRDLQIAKKLNPTFSDPIMKRGNEEIIICN